VSVGFRRPRPADSNVVNVLHLQTCVLQRGLDGKYRKGGILFPPAKPFLRASKDQFSILQ
jgi:hypothetical protein